MLTQQKPLQQDRKEHLHRFVVQLGLQLLGIGHFPHSLHEILLGDVLSVRADGKQACAKAKVKVTVSADKLKSAPTCFCAHVPQVGSIKTIRQLHNGLEIYSGRDHLSVTRAHITTASLRSASRAAGCSLTDLPVLGDGTGVDLQDVQASLLIGQLNV